MGKRGDRKLQILQTLARMLEQPAAEKITTAALAANLEVSEAALYRHFASKAQMFEGLIEFIEAGNQAAAIELTCMHLNAIEQAILASEGVRASRTGRERMVA